MNTLSAQLASNHWSNHLRAWLILIIWLILWSLLFYSSYRYNNTLILPLSFSFAFMTYGCIWEMNHISMHLCRYVELPRMFVLAKKQHLNHHRDPDNLEHILVPPWGWVALNKGAMAMGGLTALLVWFVLQGWKHLLLGLDLMLGIAYLGYAGTWAFMYLYQFCHDTAHANRLWFIGAPHPSWRTNWRMLLWPASHMQHHVEAASRYGIFPIFQILELCFPVFREAMWVARWIEDRRNGKDKT